MSLVPYVATCADGVKERPHCEAKEHCQPQAAPASTKSSQTAGIPSSPWVAMGAIPSPARGVLRREKTAIGAQAWQRWEQSRRCRDKKAAKVYR